ncbi:MAG TPA: AEC family transporter, partial [Ramlibacter sp.]|nr:AEC family transporter [Ramlibacter sp.]
MNANLASLIQQVGPLFGVIVVGALFRAFGILPAEVAPLVSRVVMTLTLPALVFTAIRSAGTQNIPFTPDLLKMPLLAYAVMLVSGMLAWVIGRQLHLARPAQGALILSATFGSTAFLGYPIIAALVQSNQIGPSGLLGHVLYSEIGTLVALVTVGLIVASFYGEGAGFSWRNLLAVPRAAPFIALLIGLLFYNDPLPQVLTNLMSLMAGTTSFLMMLYLGMSLVGSGLLTYWRPVVATQAIKLAVAPLLALGLSFALQMGSDMRSVAVIDSATPTILLCLAYSAQYRLDQRLATALVFSSFLFSLITLFIWLALIVH